MNALIEKHWKQVNECGDLLGADFVARTYSFKGIKGEAVTTLVNHTAHANQNKAILYVHGYTDYFFQTGLAEHFIRLGYRFYAVDLQGYGRSLRPSTPPNWCDSIAQYHDDLDIALGTMAEDGVEEVVFLAHSTGGLVVSHYLTHASSFAFLENTNQQDQDQDQKHRLFVRFPRIMGIALNSPFLALPFSPKHLKRITRPIRYIVSSLPFVQLTTKKATLYAQSLHTQYDGEWDYRLDWKPAEGFCLSFQWLREIIKGQEAVANKKIHIPTLLCRSAISTIGAKNTEGMQKGDGVLNVDSMQEAADNTFTELENAVIQNGFHDLYLSHETARNTYLNALTHWLTTLK